MIPIPVTVLPYDGAPTTEQGERGLWVAMSEGCAVVAMASTRVDLVNPRRLLISPEWLASDGLPLRALVSVRRDSL